VVRVSLRVVRVLRRECFHGGVTLEVFRTRYRAVFLLVAAVVPLLLSAGLAAFRGSITNATAALVLVLFVIVVAASSDRLAGVVAALSSGIWFDFFLTEPYQQFAMSDPNDVEDVVLLMLVGAGVTEVALWGRRQQGRASRRAGYLDGVLQTAEVVASGAETRTDVVSRVADQIRELLAIDRCRFVAGTAPSSQAPRIHPDGTVSRHGMPVNVNRDGLPVDEETALVVSAGGRIRGHYLLTSASRVARPSPEQLRVAVLLADQVGTSVADPGQRP
jgi:K+-sensing histidine kinase KdpD